MSLIRILIIALLSTPLFTNATPAIAQSGYFLNGEGGSSQGRIDNDGFIYGEGGSSQGRIDHDGFVYNANGRLVGSVEGPSGSSDTHAGFSKEQMLAALRLLHNAH